MTTLGRLIDELLIVHLKMEHNAEEAARTDLREQASRLLEEILAFITLALKREIPPERLTAQQHKVHSKDPKAVAASCKTLPGLAREFATVQDEMWHNQEHIYNFASVPEDRRVQVVDLCAEANLHRNNCMDAIDMAFKSLVFRCG